MHEELDTISPLDLGWLLVESDSTPMHVGCVQVFQPPAGTGADFVAVLYEQLIAQRTCIPPFSLRMHRQGLSLPRWESVDHHQYIIRTGALFIRRAIIPAPWTIVSGCNMQRIAFLPWGYIY